MLKVLLSVFSFLLIFTFLLVPSFAENEISISPDRSSYVVNEIVTISGTLDNSTAGGTVTSTITNPHHGGVIREREISINDDYTFEDKFALDYRVWKFSGDYTYEIEGKQIVIKYNRINSTEIIIEFDKISDHNGNVEYYYNETIHITGEVSQITEGNNIHVVIENDDDIYDEDYNKILDTTLTVNSDRTFSFDINATDININRYTIKSYYDIYYGKIHFDYEHGIDHSKKIKIESTLNGFSPSSITIEMGNQILARNIDENNIHSFVSGVVIDGIGIPDGIFNSGDLGYGEPIHFDDIVYHANFIGTLNYFCSVHPEEQGILIIENTESITIQTDKDSYFNNQTVNLIMNIPADKIKKSFNIATYDSMNEMISFIQINNPSVGNNIIRLLPANNNSMDIPGTYTVMVLGKGEPTTFEYISNEPHWN